MTFEKTRIWKEAVVESLSTQLDWMMTNMRTSIQIVNNPAEIRTKSSWIKYRNYHYAINTLGIRDIGLIINLYQSL
jgi:hypothetical protein